MYLNRSLSPWFLIGKQLINYIIVVIPGRWCCCLCLSGLVNDERKRKRKRERKRERERKRKRERGRERGREREKEGEKEKERKRKRERERKKERKRERKRERGRERKRGRERGRERVRKCSIKGLWKCVIESSRSLSLNLRSSDAMRIYGKFWKDKTRLIVCVCVS